MSEAVVVALCSFAATLLTGLGGYQLIAYRVEQLEKKVEKHSAAVSRTAAPEERRTVSTPGCWSGWRASRGRWMRCWML